MSATAPAPAARGLVLQATVALVVAVVGGGIALYAAGANSPPESGLGPAGADPVVVAAGDIAGCDWVDDEATAALLEKMEGTVLVLGDTGYPAGRTKDMAECYDPSWGQLLERTRPVPGNHDYDTPGAEPYFRYFGQRAGPAGKGWYSFDLGSWHLVALNSECDHLPDGCDEDSEQIRWLRDDLSRTRATCVLAYWHQARFSSGYHGDQDHMEPAWRVLDEARADLVLASHDHDYERLGPLDPDGQPSPDGMPSFVVGTGGAPLRAFETSRPGSQVRDSEHHGVLRLVLQRGGYAFAFVDAAGRILDEGTGRCRP